MSFGSTAGVAFVSPFLEQNTETMYFHNLVNSLVSVGYERDKTVLGASYDWRKAYHENDEFKAGFRDLIKHAYSSDNKSAVIICHSMGCTFAYSFLKKMMNERKSTFIKSLIIIGAPFGGTFKYMYGYFADEDYPLIPGVRIVERTLSSHALL
jgi:lysophospholipase-3